MYRSILLPMDGSELAEVVLPYAEEVAGRMGSNIILMSVLEPGKEQARRVTQCYLDSVGRDLKDGAAKYGGKDISITTIIKEGDPAEEILKYAEEQNVSQIMLATHGRTGLSRWALGSVAFKVATASVTPVVQIRAKGGRPDVREKGIMRSVLVPLDGTTEGEAVLPYIEERATIMKYDVILFNMVEINPNLTSMEALEHRQKRTESAQAYLDKIAERIRQKGVKVTTELRTVLGGEQAREIIKVADEFNVDLVAMTTHAHTGFGRWLHDNIQQTVLTEGNTPLLLVRSESDLKEHSQLHDK